MTVGKHYGMHWIVNFFRGLWEKYNDSREFFICLFQKYVLGQVLQLSKLSQSASCSPGLCFPFSFLVRPMGSCGRSPPERKVAQNGPNIWIPATHVGNQDGVPGSWVLGSVWHTPSCFDGHIRSTPIHENARSVFASFSVTLLYKRNVLFQ